MVSTVPVFSPRRRQLVEAAVEVVARSGMRGLTHRAVDAEAGLPLGTCSAYLRTRLALSTALVEHVAGALSADVEALADRLVTVDQPELAARETADLFARWLTEPAMVKVRAELMLEAIRQPELMRVYRPWRDRLVAVVARIIAAHGHDDPEPRAAVVVAALEGVLVAGLLEPSRQRGPRVRAAVDLVVGALAAYEPDR